MADLKNELSWSFSRDRQFKDCARSYYWQYYGSWGGWDKAADATCRKAYILKNVRNIDIWIGDIVHQLIKHVLTNRKHGKDVSHEEARETAQKLLKRSYLQSSERQWESNIKHNLNLFEHYYDCLPPKEEFRTKMEKAARCIDAFYACGVLDGADEKSIVSVDEFDAFTHDGIKIWAIPDFVIKRGNKHVIYDWKTGKPSEKDMFQLSLYIGYAQEKWGIAPVDVEIIPVYLSRDDVALTPGTPTSLTDVYAFVNESYATMKALLKDPYTVDIDACPQTDDIHACRRCKYKELCGR
jgi:CRISPR/Cas system-associated exonuclease Cas4 (RecB family)